MPYLDDLEKTSRKLFPLYLVLVAFVPIPLGSNRPWAWGILAVVSFSMMAYYLWNYARGNLRPPEITRDVKIIFSLFVFWIAFQIFQLVPISIELLESFSFHTTEIKQNALKHLTSQYMSISFDMSAGLQSVVKSIVYLTLFVLTVCLLQSRDRVRTLFLVIALIGVIQAVWGITSAFIEQEAVRGSADPNFTSDVHGTFVNRNHFAGFMNMAIAACLGLLIAVGIREKRKIHRDIHKHHWQSRLFDWRMHIFPYLLIMLLGLVLAQSRAGLASFIIMIITLVLCFAAKNISMKQLFSSYKWPITLAIFVLIFVGADVVFSRFMEIQQNFYDRMGIWETSFRIFKDFWITGVGSGSFQHIYPLYDTGEMIVQVNHAHNDYLEFAVEQGIVGLGTLGLIICICVKNTIHAIYYSDNIRNCAFAIASLLAIVSILAHSTFDFNLQIPSNAMYFFIFLGIGLLQGITKVHKEKREVVWDDTFFINSTK